MEKTFEQVINKATLDLFNAYYPFYFKKYPRTKKQVYSKFYNSFYKTASLFCIRDGFDPEKFVKSQMMEEFKFPQQFCNEKAWDDYIDKLPVLGEIDPELEIVEKIVSAGLELKRYETVEKWLSIIVNQRMLEEGKMRFTPYLFAFSSTFIKYCHDNNIIVYDLPSLRDKVNALKSSKKIIAKIKEVLKDDYFTFYEDAEKELERLKIYF